MKLDETDFLRLVENNNSIVFFDLESTGFKGDYNSIIVGSILHFKYKNATNHSIAQVGNDKRVVREIKEHLEAADCWVTYYGKGFDIPMLNTRLLKWGMKPVEKRPHLDLYFTLKSNLNTSRKGLGHMVRWLQVPDKEQKMDVSPDTWASLATDFDKNIRIMEKRCESDVVILRDLYNRTKHLVREIKR